MASIISPPEILTHPNNRKYLREAVAREKFELPNGVEICFDPLVVRYRFSELIPERNIETRWHPPPADFDRFIEYGYGDEFWLRPQGIGRLEYIDKGPLFMLCDFSAFDRRSLEFAYQPPDPLDRIKAELSAFPIRNPRFIFTDRI